MVIDGCDLLLAASRSVITFYSWLVSLRRINTLIEEVRSAGRSTPGSSTWEGVHAIKLPASQSLAVLFSFNRAQSVDESHMILVPIFLSSFLPYSRDTGAYLSFFPPSFLTHS